MSAAHPRLVDDMVRAIADRSWVSGAKSAPFWLDGRDEPDVLVTPKGILYMRGITLGPHDPALFNLSTTDFDFDPEATCPKFDAWLDWFTCGDKTLATFILSVLAYILLPSLQFQRYFVFLGKGNNGKQVLFRLIEKLVGGNFSAVPLERFGDRFTMAGIIGRAVNICADLDENEHRKGNTQEGVLKMVVDGSTITVEDRFKPLGYAVLQTRFVFGCNKMIYFRDQSEGTWRRPVIIPCNAVVSDEQKIPGFEKTLYEELPGILNRVLAAAQHLLTLRDLEIPECCKTLTSQYRLEQDSASEFCKTHMVLGMKKNFVPEEEMFSEYVRWCESRRGKPVGFHRFTHTFGDVWKKEKDSHAIYYTKREVKMEVAWGKRASSTKRATGWAGLRLVDPADEGDVEEEEVVVPVAPKPVEPVRSTAPAVIYHFPFIDRLRDALVAVEISSVDRLLDELLGGDVTVPTRQSPETVHQATDLRVNDAEAAAAKAEKKVAELKLKIQKAERKAKELAGKAEAERKRAEGTQ